MRADTCSMIEEKKHNGSRITFITGNQGKADYLAKYLGHPVAHRKVDLDEIQSMDLNEIVEHKVRQAFSIVKSPVIVEDVALEFEALNGLPGPFIRFFIDHIPFETICSLLDGKSRNATAKCVYGYCDGEEIAFFEGRLPGTIAQSPAGERGYGWDKFFIPEGHTITRASLSEEEYKKSYLQLRPFAEMKRFFEGL